MATRAYTYKCYPSKTAVRSLLELRAIACWFWNALLQQRQEAYERQRLTISGYAQSREVTVLKEACATDSTLRIPYGTQALDPNNCPRTMISDVIERLDLAFKSFFRRVKVGARGGYPRFKGRRFWRSIGVQVGNGIRFADLPTSGIGTAKLVIYWGRGKTQQTISIPIFLHRKLGVPKHVILEEQADGWHATVQCDNIAPMVEVETGAQIGIDVGIKSFATLSDGDVIKNPRLFETAQKLLRRVQRQAARGKKGSSRWRKKQQRAARIHLRIANARKDFHHKLSRKLVRGFDRIYVEDLNISGLARSRLAKQVADVGWGQFLTILESKAKESGKIVVRVDPRGTSQLCSGCGSTVKKKLSERTHKCPQCGLVLDRDLNAALNIADRGQKGLNAGKPARRTDRPLLDVEGPASKGSHGNVNTCIDYVANAGVQCTNTEGANDPVMRQVASSRKRGVVGGK